MLHSLSGPKNDGSVSETILRNSRSVSQEEDDQYVSGRGRESIQFLSRKRKRNNINNDDLEGRYMHRLDRQEAKEDMKSYGERSSKRHMQEADIVTATLEEPDSSLDSNDVMKEDDKERPDLEIPTHESLASPEKDLELGKASRTVFLANVSTIAIKSKSARRTLIDHLESFITTLPEQDVVHKVESLRFRSTAFSSNALPKKAAYVKKELMDSTTKSTNAYAVYSTKLAAKEAVNSLNGTIVLDRHLRVDGVAHPAKIDHRRCVFIGNLSFVNDESMINAEQDEENNRRPRKGKEPADAEEGLWRQFSNAGVVESVRVIRDKTTRVGKGFAYVQFKVLQCPSCLDVSLIVILMLSRMRMGLRKRCFTTKRSFHRCYHGFCESPGPSLSNNLPRAKSDTKSKTTHRHNLQGSINQCFPRRRSRW